jgi:hypothetical protein
MLETDIIPILQYKLYLDFYYCNLAYYWFQGVVSPFDIYELFVNEPTLRMATSLEDSIISEIHNHLQASQEKILHITTKNATINENEL